MKTIAASLSHYQIIQPTQTQRSHLNKSFATKLGNMMIGDSEMNRKSFKR